MSTQFEISGVGHDLGPVHEGIRQSLVSIMGDPERVAITLPRGTTGGSTIGENPIPVFHDGERIAEFTTIAAQESRDPTVVANFGFGRPTDESYNYNLFTGKTTHRGPILNEHNSSDNRLGRQMYGIRGVASKAQSSAVPAVPKPSNQKLAEQFADRLRQTEAASDMTPPNWDDLLKS